MKRRTPGACATKLAATDSANNTPDRFQEALALHQSGHRSQAQAIYKEVIRTQPRNCEVLHLLGVTYSQEGKHRKALDLIGRAISLCPDQARFHSNLGIALAELGRLEEAVASYDRAIAINAQFVDAHFNRANALLGLKQFDAAIGSYDRAIAIQPAYAQAHYNRGLALKGLKRIEEALASYDRAIAIAPGYALAHCNRGNALTELRRLEEAMASYDQAIVVGPQCAEAWYNRGVALVTLERRDEALASFDRAIAIRPRYAEAFHSRGELLERCEHVEAAVESYEKAIAIKPDTDYLLGTLLHARMKLCDWRNFEADTRELFARIGRHERVATSFSVLALVDSLALQREAATIFAEDKCPPDGSLGPIPRRLRSGKIRLGYFSADFHQHATMQLIAGVFEQHDREKFELVAFSLGLPNEDEMRQRVRAAFDDFIEAHHRSDRQIAELARNMAIDIAIDLKGFTQDERSRIFAYRAAPLQVSYLGYPGTTGSANIDYLLADRVLVPSGSEAHYSEKIVFLPESYQANDRKRTIAARTFTRAEVGLPDQGPVFCCFNAHYKITPAMFDGWMRILRRVPGSVLWLLDGASHTLVNLRREAAHRGVGPDRLIFAPRLPLADHLARVRLADLFLDTLPCNAHTTASDALWAGLPVLTRAGESFAGRVAASLLHAIGLPELITHSEAEYEALAVELATSRERLMRLRQSLARNRLTAPLFDTTRITRHIEAAYVKMLERHDAGLAPDHIDLA